MWSIISAKADGFASLFPDAGLLVAERGCCLTTEISLTGVPGKRDAKCEESSADQRLEVEVSVMIEMGVVSGLTCPRQINSTMKLVRYVCTKVPDMYGYS